MSGTLENELQSTSGQAWRSAAVSLNRDTDSLMLRIVHERHEQASQHDQF